MSKGTKVYPVRIATELMADVRRTITRRNWWSRRPPWSLSEFIRVAIVNQLKKMERSRRGGHRRKVLQLLQLMDPEEFVDIEAFRESIDSIVPFQG